MAWVLYTPPRNQAVAPYTRQALNDYLMKVNLHTKGIYPESPYLPLEESVQSPALLRYVRPTAENAQMLYALAYDPFASLNEPRLDRQAAREADGSVLDEIWYGCLLPQLSDVLALSWPQQQLDTMDFLGIAIDLRDTLYRKAAGRWTPSMALTLYTPPRDLARGMCASNVSIS